MLQRAPLAHCRVVLFGRWTARWLVRDAAEVRGSLRARPDETGSDLAAASYRCHFVVCPWSQPGRLAGPLRLLAPLVSVAALDMLLQVRHRVAVARRGLQVVNVAFERLLLNCALRAEDILVLVHGPLMQRYLPVIVLE